MSHFGSEMDYSAEQKEKKKTTPPECGVMTSNMVDISVCYKLAKEAKSK